MSADPPSSERLGEVSRLVTSVADQALDALIMGRPVPAEQIAALMKAAQLLEDHGVEWPPLLEQVLHDLMRETGEDDVAPSEPAPVPEAPSDIDIDIGGLTRFFSGLRKGKGEL